MFLLNSNDHQIKLTIDELGIQTIRWKYRGLPFYQSAKQNLFRIFYGLHHRGVVSKLSEKADQSKTLVFSAGDHSILRVEATRYNPCDDISYQWVWKDKVVIQVSYYPHPSRMGMSTSREHDIGFPESWKELIQALNLIQFQPDASFEEQASVFCYVIIQLKNDRILKNKTFDRYPSRLDITNVLHHSMEWPAQCLQTLVREMAYDGEFLLEDPNGKLEIKIDEIEIGTITLERLAYLDLSAQKVIGS